MNKEQFNQLEPLEQLEYINNNLHNMSLTKLCEDIGVNRSTITKRFKRLGYTFNKYFNQYALTIEQQQNEYKDNTKEQPTNKIDNTTFTIKCTDVLNNKVKALEERINGLEAIINDLISNNKVDDTIDTTKGIRFYKGADTVRAYRVDYEVQQRLKDYCYKHNEYKVKDIVSTALEEFLEKYDI